MEKTRLNLNMSVELKEWYVNQAKSFGTSYSALMVIALSSYKQQMESLTQLKGLPSLVEKMEKMQGEQEKNTNTIKCSCYKCGSEVPSSVEEHFTSADGRILCDRCCVGVEPINEKTKDLLIQLERKNK